jgi:hypothetical protein
MGLISVAGYEPKHLSYSTISSYRMCGKKTYFEKVLQLEQRPGLAALGGNAVHTASERIDEFILEHGFEALDAPASAPLDTNDGLLEPDF